jgi:hypothetical protein
MRVCLVDQGEEMDEGIWMVFLQEGALSVYCKEVKSGEETGVKTMCNFSFLIFILRNWKTVSRTCQYTGICTGTSIHASHANWPKAG